MSGEPVRNGLLDAVVDVCTMALSTPQSWGSFPTCPVERRYKLITQLGNALRVLVLDDDGSESPAPENRDGDIDDRFHFVLVIQAQGDSGTSPSQWGNRVLDTLKRGLRSSVFLGALAPYTKQPIDFAPEAVLYIPDGEGRYAEFLLPCTAWLPDNLGGAA